MNTEKTVQAVKVGISMSDKIIDQALEIARMKKALRYLADNPGAHPTNVVMIARDALGENE